MYEDRPRGTFGPKPPTYSISLTHVAGIVAFDKKLPTSLPASFGDHQVFHTCRWEREDTVDTCY